jgi:hypothetical protein
MYASADAVPVYPGSSLEKVLTIAKSEKTNPGIVISSWHDRAWATALILAVIVLITSIPGYIEYFPKGFTENRFAVNPDPLVFGLNFLSGVFSYTSALVSLILAVVLFRRRKAERMALFLSYFLLIHGVFTSGPIELLEVFVEGISQVATGLVEPIIMIPLMYYFFTRFPDGEFVPSWTKRLAPLVVFASLNMIFLTPNTDYSDFASNILPDLWNGILFTTGVILAVFFGGLFLYAQVYRWRNVSNKEQKQQTKWVVLGGSVWLLMLGISSIPWTYSFSLPPTTPFPLWLAAASSVWSFANMIIPVTLTLAVLRYRLYDIDIIINRTLVYGVLTAITMGIYVMAVHMESVMTRYRC